MKILMTNQGLRQLGGSELFIKEMAIHLASKGHEICVFSTLVGQVSEALATAGIPVVTSPNDCPFVPELIHGQHHLETMTAIASWPGTPAVYLCHGYAPWDEQPPQHPRLVRYLVMAQALVSWLAETVGADEDSIGVVPNAFDPERFSRVRKPQKTARKALVFHNTMNPDGDAFAEIQKGCDDAGVELETLGANFGRTVNNPEDILADYDVVFAGGRSAIEAMASGCAVIPIGRDDMTALVDPQNFETLTKWNFCPYAGNFAITRSAVRGELERISPKDTAEVTRRIRGEHSLDAAAKALLEIYQDAIKALQPEPIGENVERAMSAYLLTLTEQLRGVDERRHALKEQKERADERTRKWRSKAIERGKRLDWLDSSAGKGSWWQRRWWRRLRREWEATEKRDR